MSRIDPLAGSLPVLSFAADEDLQTPLLPREHPKWMKDAIAISQRARTLVSRLRPVVVRVLTFWDHHVRTISLHNGHLSVDPSGSYRFE